MQRYGEQVPYYLYAIHTDKTDNRLYQRFDDFRQGEKLEKEMKAGNYLVIIFLCNCYMLKMSVMLT